MHIICVVYRHMGALRRPQYAPLMGRIKQDMQNEFAMEAPQIMPRAGPPWKLNDRAAVPITTASIFTICTKPRTNKPSGQCTSHRLSEKMVVRMSTDGLMEGLPICGMANYHRFVRGN